MVRKLVLLFFLMAVAAAAWVAWTLYSPVNPGGEKFVLLRPGWSSQHIAQELQRQGIIRSARTFLVLHYLDAHTLKAGEYRFHQPASAREVNARLVRGDIYRHTVVIPEGFNMFDIAAAIENSGLATRDQFLQAARTDLVLIKDLDPDATSLEGYLFPDTYAFTRTQSVHDLAAEMVHRFRQQAQQIGLTEEFHRVVTMASIVEKETAAPEERPVVASVYYNRLQQHIALAADPSVIYAALLAARYTGVIRQSDLTFDSPYNTYRYAGLPPGPIANPGTSALEAAMHPASTDYLYFVADGSGDGHHRFARTLEEHARNVAAYRRATAATR